MWIQSGLSYYLSKRKDYRDTKKIILPAGGVTEYNFEPNEFFYDKSTPGFIASLKDYVDPYIQHFALLQISNYNTSQSSTLSLNISGDPTKKKKIYFGFFAEPGRIFPPIGGGGFETDPGDGTTPVVPNLKAEFKIDNGAVDIVYCSRSESPTDCSSSGYFEVYPGNHTIQIVSPGSIKGNFSTSELITDNPPYKNIGYGEGLRIKDIKSFISPSDTTPAKAVHYTYNDFENTNNPSGYLIQNESYVEEEGSSQYIVYKNITENSESDEGYTRFYLRTPSDYPDTQYTTGGQIFDLKHYYNITKSGLLNKKEAFNSNNIKVHSLEYEYELEDQNGTVPVQSSMGYVRPGIIKRMTVFDKNYSNSQVLINKTEQEFTNSARNFQLLKTKTTSSDGNIIENEISYPIKFVIDGQINEYAHLWAANMKGGPVSRIEKNGKIVSSVNTKFANNSLYPTSIVNTNANDNTINTVIKYDNYDEKGNLVQFTNVIDEAANQGFPTAVVWGYNKTLPIAKVQGGTLSEINSLITDIVSKSNVDVDDNSEKVLLEALDLFRTNNALKKFQITTYTYNPMIGTTSSTLPNGIREIYKYDGNSRLQYIVDVNGNILKDYRYNTKPQQ